MGLLMRIWRIERIDKKIEKIAYQRRDFNTDYAGLHGLLIRGLKVE